MNLGAGAASPCTIGPSGVDARFGIWIEEKGEKLTGSDLL
jgi:hypothetical protein